MVEENRESDPTIDLEEILTLKRSERPNSEFWQSFDRSLNERMLQSIVKRETLSVRLLRNLFSKQSLLVGSTVTCLLIFGVFLLQPSDRDPIASKEAGSSLTSSVSIAASLEQTGALLLDKAEFVIRNSAAYSYEIQMGDAVQFETSAYALQNHAVNTRGQAYRSDYSYDSVELSSGDSTDYGADVLSYAPIAISKAGSVFSF